MSRQPSSTGQAVGASPDFLPVLGGVTSASGGSRDAFRDPWFRVAVDVDQGIVHVSGELDVLTAAPVSTALELTHSIATGDAVWLDLAGCSFLDPAGMRPIARSAARLQADGTRLLLRRPIPSVERTLRLGRLDHLLASPDPTTPAGSGGGGTRAAIIDLTGHPDAALDRLGPPARTADRSTAGMPGGHPLGEYCPLPDLAGQARGDVGRVWTCPGCFSAYRLTDGHLSDPPGRSSGMRWQLAW